MSRESTALGGAIERLVDAGNTVHLTVRPGLGQNKSTAEVVDSTDAVTAKFTAATLTELADQITTATKGSAPIVPTDVTLAAISYMHSIGSGARFFPLDSAGEMVINPELETPAMYKQNAAAIRNGRVLGAVAVFDAKNETTALIPVLK